MSQNEKEGVSSQAADELLSEIAAQVAVQAKRHTDTQDAAKRIVQLSADIQKNEAVLRVAFEGAKQKIPRLERSVFNAFPRVAEIKSDIALAEEKIGAFKKGDGTPEHAAALKDALCREEMRAAEKPSEATVRKFATEIAELAHLKVLDSKKAKEANGGEKYPAGAAVYKEICMTPDPEYFIGGRQSRASLGLCSEFRDLVRRYYAVAAEDDQAKFAAIEQSKRLSDNMQDMAHGIRGMYRPHLSAHNGKKAGYAVVEVRYSTGGQLEVLAVDGAGSLASVAKFAESNLSLPIKKREGEEIVGSKEFGWIPGNIRDPRRADDLEQFRTVLRLAILIFNKNGREVVASPEGLAKIDADFADAERAAEQAKIDADLEATERHIAEGEKLLAEADEE